MRFSGTGVVPLLMKTGGGILLGWNAAFPNGYGLDKLTWEKENIGPLTLICNAPEVGMALRATGTRT